MQILYQARIDKVQSMAHPLELHPTLRKDSMVILYDKAVLGGMDMLGVLGDGRTPDKVWVGRC